MRTIPQSALLKSIYRHRGWRYRNGASRYAAPLPGVQVKMAPPEDTDCCSFWEDSIFGALLLAGVQVPYSLDMHDLACIVARPGKRARPFGPVEVYTTLGLADLVAAKTTPVAWTLVQGWKVRGKDEDFPNGWLGGHTFGIGAVGKWAPPMKCPVLRVEASDSPELGGVGYRGVGTLDKLTWEQALAALHEGRSPWTWERVCDTYPHLRQCSLRVDPAA